MKFSKLEKEYRDLLSRVKFTRSTSIEKRASKLIKNKHRYKSVALETNVPWYVIASIHYRESANNFARHLHNGDSLKRRTVHVPSGRPKSKPPFTWEESAIDAIRLRKLHLVKDWSMERICFELEGYNGWGYRQYHSNTLSPYLWSGTNLYKSGKYVADGKWSSKAHDKQLGTVALVLSVLNKEPNLTAKEIVKKSKKLTLLSHVKKFSVFAVTTLLSLFTMETFELASGFIGDLTIMTKSNSVLIIAGLLVAGWIVGDYIKKQSIADYKAGRYIPSGEFKDD